MSGDAARTGDAPESRARPGLHPAIPRAAPFAAFIVLLALQPVVDSPWLAAARGLVVAALLALFWRHYAELSRPEAPATAGSAALAFAVGAAVFAAWIAFDSGWAVVGGEGRGFVPLRADGTLDPALVALRLFGLALVVPVMEELFWRSLVMRWIQRKDFLALDPRSVGGAAFALSSALFAIEHSQWFAGAIAGAAYGWLYMRCRNLWIPILSHATTNALLGVWILATASWRLW